MKTLMPKLKNAVDALMADQMLQKNKIHLEDIAREIIQNETHREEKKNFKK